ncbi:type I restriction-modification system subunit M [Lentisalinibacter sediminis]|uniref:type I restriction-modification system subunit M n=1 Tax=Lentisalinibacter sediminis TaxID=2992237 RepID=UPI00386DFBB2
MDQKNLGSHIWNVAELLRGNFRQSEYGTIILPFTVLRRLECVLEPTRDAVVERSEQIASMDVDPTQVLPSVSGHKFYNTSTYSLGNLGVADTLSNLVDYVASFSPNARQIFEQFGFESIVQKLHDDKLLYQICNYFAGFDLHPDTVSNHEMGLAFEHLIRLFAESANDTAGEHYTPRDVVRLATTLVFSHDADALRGDGVIRSIYDPACGTGGFLSSGIEQIHEWNSDASVVPFGQELNDKTHAIAVADMMIKGYNTENIKLGNTLSDDQLYTERFDYCLANPPFGVDWKKVRDAVQAEHKRGDKGRFGPGLPRVSDGSLLFLMHLISKMKTDAPTRIGIVLNGSPLFTGNAGSGESEIRRWILENDWLEAIVALPTDMFYNTGIATYIWLLTNRKADDRKGKVQLINATHLWRKMRKSLGSKRREMSEDQIAEVARLFADNREAHLTDDDGTEIPVSRIFNSTEFGYRTITVERPLVGDDGEIERYTSGAKKGQPKPDTKLRDTEDVPLHEDVDEYLEREVKPHVPDAWIDHDKTKIGYEIPFNRHFYVFKPPRSLAEIDAELKEVTGKIVEMIREIGV